MDILSDIGIYLLKRNRQMYGQLTTANCVLVGRLDVLKKHILTDRMSVPISGMANAAKIAHIQATRSSSGRLTINCLSLPGNIGKYILKACNRYSIIMISRKED